ncbi:MAG: hypothetical protein ABSD21_04010 [Rhizomicrobium sp.]|jgi:hypothetical protein
MNAVDPLPPDDYDEKQRTNLLVIGVAVFIVVVTVLLMLMLKHGIELQDCFAAGHHNCAPVETTEQH